MTETEWQLEMLAKIGADTRRLLNSLRQQGSEELIAATVTIATALIEKVSGPDASGRPEADAVEVSDPGVPNEE